MNKIIGILSLGLLLGCLAGTSEAASARGGAKPVKSVNYTTTVSSVAVNGSATVYQVILSSGTAGTDYLALWDSATTGAISGIAISTNLKAKVVVSSATQNTVVTFDPPLLFTNGIVAANSAATMWSAITYERGRAQQ